MQKLGKIAIAELLGTAPSEPGAHKEWSFEAGVKVARIMMMRAGESRIQAVSTACRYLLPGEHDGSLFRYLGDEIDRRLDKAGAPEYSEQTLQMLQQQ